MEEDFRLVVIEPQSETLSQKQKLALLSKTIGSKCLKREINTSRKLFECANEISASRL